MNDTYLNAANLKKILFEIGTSLGIDNSIVDATVMKVKNSKIQYLPIRHHSPGSTILIKKWIKKYKPKLVLIEGPALADGLIKYMVDKGTVPPIAILSLFSDTNNIFGLNGICSPDASVPAKFEAYYPFISYSTELVALSESMKQGIPVHFIDLPLTGLISKQSKNLKEKPNEFDLRNLHEESIYNLSTFYQKFAHIFDFENFNEAWETIFEIGTNNSDINQLRESMLLFCAFLLQTIDEKVLEVNGSLARESYMKYSINNYVKKYKVNEKDVLVITGGMHSIALPGSLPKKVSFPTKGLINSLVPFSYYRISQKSGYVSGNQAPQFYELIWKKFTSKSEHPYEAVALDLIADIFQQARIKGNMVSISDSINSFQGAKMLAMLRRREEPCLKDLTDAIYMSLVKGNPEIDGKYLEALIQDKIIGHKVGKITKKMGRLPLQEDFYLQLKSYGIDLDEKTQFKNLNLRDDTDSKVSQLFWKIKFLGIRFLERLIGPDLLCGETGTFTEKWSLKWNHRIDASLVELSTYGSTLEEASKNKLIEEIKKNIKNFGLITNLLFQSLSMGYIDHFEDLKDECLNSLDEDYQFLSLAEGFLNLIMIYRYLSMMKIPKKTLDLMEQLIQRSYHACCFSIPNFVSPPSNEEVTYINTIKMLANLLTSIQNIDIDLNVYIESVSVCVDNSNNEFVKGGAIGILYLINNLSVPDIEKIILDYLNSIDSIIVKIGDLFRGLIHVCQAKLLFNQGIIKLMASVVEAVNWDVFSAILPALRKAFSELNPREYDVFLEKLAEHYGLISKKKRVLKGVVKDDIKNFLKIVDKKVREVFEEWFGEV